MSPIDAMANEDIHGRIETLERAGEVLAETIEDCRKAILIAKALMCVGGIVFAANILGLLRLPLAAALTCVGAIIGGIVWYGSNHSTREEALEKLKAIEAERARAIDALDFRGGGVTLH